VSLILYNISTHSLAKFVALILILILSINEYDLFIAIITPLTRIAKTEQTKSNSISVNQYFFLLSNLSNIYFNLENKCNYAKGFAYILINIIVHNENNKSIFYFTINKMSWV
jgi:hypothetical protein